MDLGTFASRLHDAVTTARDFARTFVKEPLPDPIALRTRLNGSYDGHPPQPGERRYPEDSKIELQRLEGLSAEEASRLLWRDGAVPQWINAQVESVSPTATIVELLCCGRFDATDDRLYHQHEGRPPFHVLGPVLPYGWKAGDRFSIFNRSTCRSLEELSLVRDHAADVKSLVLEGSTFCDADVAAMPPMPSLGSLELDAIRLRGSGLMNLVDHAALRLLRLRLRPRSSFQSSWLPRLPLLEELEVAGLRTGALGFETLSDRVPSLARLKLRANDALNARGDCPPHVEQIVIAARCIDGIPRLPARMDSVSIHLTSPRGDEVAALLSSCQHVEALHLRDTPLTEQLVMALIARLHPRYVDIVGTGIDRHAVQRIGSAYPKLKMHPQWTP